MGKWSEFRPAQKIQTRVATANPQKSPLGSQKSKNDPKIKSKSNFIIEGNIEKKLFKYKNDPQN